MLGRILSIIITGGALLLGSACPSWAGLKYEGSAPIGELIMPNAAQAFEAKTKIKFDVISAKGTEDAFKALAEKRADIGGVARSLTAEDKKQKLYFVIIGYDALAVFLNEKNTVKNLTKDQIKGIFSGEIKNWKEVGGTDAAIKVYVDGAPKRTLGKEFKKAAMSGADFGPACIASPEPHAHLTAAAADPSGITFDSVPYLRQGLKTVAVNGVEPTPKDVKSGTYLIGRPLQLATNGLPKGDVKKFIDFMLSDEGQKIVGKNFIAVK